jgi:hypothetical protein
MKLPTKPINQETFWDEIGKPILCMLLVNWGIIALLIFIIFTEKLATVGRLRSMMYDEIRHPLHELLFFLTFFLPILDIQPCSWRGDFCYSMP